MTTAAAINPLAVFLENARPHDKAPVPLRSTAFDITIEAGLAVVTTTRLFRNAEADTIEATLTFPVPVHAVLFSLDVRIGDRQLKATAREKEAARSDYEEGIDAGKTAILHEELLRGIHMLSVGNIPPGGEIEVRTIWAMPLTMAGGEGRLRIPTTVGQIYGQSPLADGDDFTWGDEVPMAEVVVRSEGAPVKIGGRPAGTEPVQHRMNQPIDLTVGEWQHKPLLSQTAEGTAIRLELSPAPANANALNLAILVDHSGSMADGVRQGETGATTVHDLVRSALQVLAGQLAKDDFIDLWEFNHDARHVGRGSGDRTSLSRLLQRLSPPDGGTEIDAALTTVLEKTEAGSVLLITDGRSHALDVQAMALRGKRISVLLVGEDSLEAQVGHLAALTGGDIFVASKDAVDHVMAAALNALRSPAAKAAAEGSAADGPIEVCRAGMMMRLQFAARAEPAARSTLEHGIAALGASLQLPRLPEGEAARLAAAEGLVTHLTSLVLVDEASAVQEGIPMRRRIPLAPPDAVHAYAGSRHVSACLSSADPSMRMNRMTPNTSSRQRLRIPSVAAIVASIASLVAPDQPTATFGSDIASLAGRIDWDTSGDALAKCDIHRLDEDLAIGIRLLCLAPAVQSLADSSGVDALRLVVILLALAVTPGNRSAARVLRHLQAGLAPDVMDRITDLAGSL